MHALASWGRRLRRSRLRRPLAAACVVLGVALWLGFAPAAMGGASTYVTTYGQSMEPTLHAGDLVVVRPKDSYEVGDVAAYRSESLGTIVLHRIIGRDGDRYVFQGDNNSWIDEDRPTEDQIVGVMDGHMTGVGRRMQQLRSPLGIGAIVGVTVVPAAARGKKRRRRERAKEQRQREPRAPRSQRRLQHVDARLAGTALAAAGVAAFALTRPTIVQSSSEIPFEDRGTFSYTAPAPDASAVYPDGAVPSGQPVFLNLVDALEVRFDYRVSSAADLTATGDVALQGSISDSTGWSYPFEIAAPTPFAADAAGVAGVLDIGDLQARVAAMEEATGADRDSYTVTVDAIVNREVTGAGAASGGAFVSKLEFDLSDLEMHLSAPGPETMQPIQGGLITTAVERRGTVDVLAASIPVSAFRAGSLAALVVVGALLAESVARSMRTKDESLLIERRYRNYLLPLRAMELSEATVVDVDSIAALARLADHTAGPILRAGPGSGVYYVVDGPRVYRYRAARVVDAVEVASEPTPARPPRRQQLRARP
jgi:signal peptidase I